MKAVFILLLLVIGEIGAQDEATETPDTDSSSSGKTYYDQMGALHDPSDQTKMIPCDPSESSNPCSALEHSRCYYPQGPTCLQAYCFCDRNYYWKNYVDDDNPGGCVAYSPKFLGDSCTNTDKCMDANWLEGTVVCDSSGASSVCACADGYTEVDTICVKGASIDAVCTNNDGCASELNLECSSGKCACPEGTEWTAAYFYDATWRHYCIKTSTAKLGLSLGEICDDPWRNPTVVKDKGGSVRMCADWAMCGSCGKGDHAVCTTDIQLSQNYDKFFRPHAARCSIGGTDCENEHEECSAPSASCAQAYCHCKNDARYDYDTGECKPFTGAKVKLEQSCTTGDICVDMDYIATRAECSGGKCACKSGFNYTEGLCVLGKLKGESCTRKADCAHELALSCVSGVCGCASGESWRPLVYYNDGKTVHYCIKSTAHESKPLEWCDVYTRVCGDHHYCWKCSDSDIYDMCLHGDDVYEPAPVINDNSLTPFVACNNADDCPRANMECSSVLTCGSHFCRCKSGYKYYYKKQECTEFKATKHLNETCESDDDCMDAEGSDEHTECKSGKCDCADGRVPYEGHCYSGGVLGAACSDTEDCATELALVCSSSKCACASDTTWKEYYVSSSHSEHTCIHNDATVDVVKFESCSSRAELSTSRAKVCLWNYVCGQCQPDSSLYCIAETDDGVAGLAASLSLLIATAIVSVFSV